MSASDDPYAQPWGSSPTGSQRPPPSVPYAHWLQRAGALLFDWLVLAACMIPLFAGLVVQAGRSTGAGDDGSVSAGAVVLIIVGALLPLAFWIWNYWREGTRGATVGKQVLGLAVIRESTGQFIGGWLALGRQILHAVDSALCYLGYLWPLWDSKRQTFADKIVGTVVVQRRP
ncbi:MAG: RDD family protein [Frankiaceae bacterium]